MDTLRTQLVVVQVLAADTLVEDWHGHAANAGTTVLLRGEC